ncbi:sensor histidine kinase [Clostridium estertheticum]|uniref:sensor histidine kinase n=1 Tax=Clostridium estertheticum TaxID=238834 RepID=UPI001CF38B59|nr:sensor histidine kinase [Clostridium estertheticum]MCB2305681.1 sensor histidine kinase [Clostridium estertheticum]MCB2344504.1 sensor histidine kinase [Clostridium estertheticum]MCB2348036.1 sensor histidine kinase [Clostridium estertheticum]WAG45679.1 sensor histidine kinase [Clostridium estertheticum]
MDFLLSGKNRFLVLKILQIIVIITIFNRPLQIHFQIITIFLIVFLAINDYIRINSNEFVKYISYILSNLIICYLAYKTKTDTITYSSLLIVELIIPIKKIYKSLFIINFVSFVFLSAILYSNILFYNFGIILRNYSINLIVCFLIKNIIIEKVKKEKLNEELEKTNLTLIQYSKKIEELTITKERTRIAQELHDSMGHSLVALSMNLEYAENIATINPEKAKIAMQDCYSISKDCMKNLRGAVSVLKENSTLSLRKDINQIFLKFKQTDKYEFNLDFDENVEKVSSGIKTCIYKTLREAITNGIKHGNATSFSIHISKSSNSIIFKIENNGVGCKKIIRSNGIIGMEERVHLLNGEIIFKSEDLVGFTIEGKIPENIL